MHVWLTVVLQLNVTLIKPPYYVQLFSPQLYPQSVVYRPTKPLALKLQQRIKDVNGFRLLIL